MNTKKVVSAKPCSKAITHCHNNEKHTWGLNIARLADWTATGSVTTVIVMMENSFVTQTLMPILPQT